jgi:phosphoribosylformylglycinamidine synthase
LRLDALLFGESPSRVLISIKPEHLDRMMKTIQNWGVPITKLGRVTQGNMDLTVQGPQEQPVCQVKVSLSEMADQWHNSLARQLGTEQS